ncbi:DUF6686 family protein [Pseudalgibacter alginicilyticus]
MCNNNIKTVSKVKNGELYVCSQCHIYHLEFNNIYLKFNRKEFENFKTYIFDIEIDYWEHKYACSKMKRKVPIPSLQTNLVLMFSREEIYELQLLLSNNSLNPLLETKDIDYTLILN